MRITRHFILVDDYEPSNSDKHDGAIWECFNENHPVEIDDNVTIVNVTCTGGGSYEVKVPVVSGGDWHNGPGYWDEEVYENVNYSEFDVEFEVKPWDEDDTEESTEYYFQRDYMMDNFEQNSETKVVDDKIDWNDYFGIECRHRGMWEESKSRTSNSRRSNKVTLDSLKRMLLESIAADDAGVDVADDEQKSENNLEDILNSLLGDEYNAWKQYTMMTMAAKGKSLARVEEVFKNAGNEEMYDHFENLYKWMQSIGMKPVNDPEELDKICGCPFVKVEREQDTVSLVEIAVKAENAAIDAYSKALEMDVVKAYPDLVYLLSEFLKDERGHLRELQDAQTQMNGFDGEDDNEGEEEVDDEDEDDTEESEEEKAVLEGLIDGRIEQSLRDYGVTPEQAHNWQNGTPEQRNEIVKGFGKDGYNTEDDLYKFINSQSRWVGGVDKAKGYTDKAIGRIASEYKPPESSSPSTSTATDTPSLPSLPSAAGATLGSATNSVPSSISTVATPGPGAFS